MNDQPSESTEAKASQPTDLLDNLRELGEALPVSFQPNAHDAGPLLAGTIWYLATGSLVAPKVDAPTQAEINAELHEATRISEAEAKVAELERKLAAQDAGPAAVAPAPVAPVEPAPSAPVDVAPPSGADDSAAIQEAINAAGAAPQAPPAAPVPAAPAQAPAPGQVDPPAAAPAPEGTVGS